LRDWLGKRISITQKNTIQKLTIKRIKIKIETQNKFYFWLNGEIEEKLIEQKNKKNDDQNLKKNNTIFLSKGEKRKTKIKN